ncbi:LysR family transcriptional regulator [Brevibacillus centrosporus]|uniref:LysR family transcriptional regulator n=1 Tax=Brevibacillus centrosporus TaxID=54910 RepID=UPI00116AF12F|nr:LysR family transcriptional regulator [Brevibacillus centrosporus]MEC2127664.1 LysR family transcriptional regulator [Brevibacillus centrosporus]GED30777.1 transcriptional regulator [Brevibacillus centrosporus]
MNIEQLQYLVETTRTGSISATAQNLHVSQSAVSKSISRMEQDLGFTLFIRSRTGIVPTPAGWKLIQKAEEILSKVSEFNDIADEHGPKAKRELKLASVPMFMLILNQSLETIMSEHPSTQIEVAEKSSKEIIYEVRNNLFDLGFLILNDEIRQDPELDYQVLMSSNTFVCINKDSPLAKKESLSPEEVIDQRIVIYNGSIKEWFRNYFNKSDYFKYSLTTNNIEAIKSRVVNGTSITFLSELSIRNHAFLDDGEIVVVPLLMNGEQIKMQIAWVKKKKNSLTKTSKELLRLLRQHIEKGEK